MEINKEMLERLWYLRTWCFDFELFSKIYIREGENPESQHSLANHMWRKFNNECNTGLLSFWKANDSGNQESIIKYLNSDEFEKRFKKDCF